jgi:hypothetical protein
MEIARVAEHLATETDDVLATIFLVDGNEKLTDRLYEQLVDLLIEGLVLDLRTALLDGEMTLTQFGNQLAELAAQCRRVGLLANI